MVRGALAKSRRTDDEASTEPLHTLLAGMQDSDAANTMPLARSKKPRVSFHSVTSATFVKDGDDPFRLSSPHERQLSPLSPAVPALGQEEDTAGSNYPFDSTPESTRRRDSSVGELEVWEQLAAKQSAKAAASSFSTPERQGGTSKPSLPINMRGLHGLPSPSRSPLRSPSCRGTPGEQTGEVTVDVQDLSGLVAEDEIASPSRGVTSQAAHLARFVSEDEMQIAAEDDMHSVGEVTGEVNLSGLVDEDEMDCCKRRVAGRPSTQSGLAVEADMETSARSSLAPANATHLPTTSPVPSEWNLFQKYKDGCLDDDDDKSVASSALAADRQPMADEDVEMPSVCAVQEEPARFSQASSRKDSAGTDTFDFAAVNQAFDSRHGNPSRSSPPRAQAPAQEAWKPKAAGNNIGLRAPGHGLLAAVGRSPLAERPPLRAVARSPPGAIGWKTSHSPKQVYGNPAQGPNTFSEPSSTLPEQLTGTSLESLPLPAQHPIQQLTGGLGTPSNSIPPNSSLFGTRTRMGWEEFVRHGDSQLMHYNDQASTQHMDVSLLGVAPAAFSCSRAQEMYVALQQGRAECLEHFISEVAQDAEQKRNDYSVAKQVWDRSHDIPSVADELMRLLPHNGTLEYDSFMTNMKEWHQYCKDAALLKWHVAKRHWLQNDVHIAQQHTQNLRDEVHRLHESAHKCKELSIEVRSSSKHMGHRTDMHETKHVFQEVQFEELRRTQEESELIRQKLPTERAALHQQQQSNAELEKRIQELKQQVRCEQVNAKEARREALQQQLRKGALEKQFHAHTCIMHKATPHAVCLRMRGNIMLWVENHTREGPSHVRVSVQLPDPTETMDPTIKVYPAFSRGLVACAWCRILADVVGASVEKLFGEVFAEPERRLEATVPCQDLQRFLRLFDVEVLRITDNVRAMRNLRKAVPEVEWFSAQFKNSPGGDEPSAELTVLLSVLRSHSVVAGVARPLTTEAWAGKFDVLQCIVKFNANLAAEPDMIWSRTSVEPMLGCVNANLVSQAMERGAPQDSLCEMLKAAVQAMQ